MAVELTASMVRSFKQCPRRYELEYGYSLSPVQAADALTIGTNYHSKVEAILTGNEWDENGVSGGMANAFHRYVPWRQWDLAGVEQEFRIRIKRGLYLKGKMDAVLTDGTPIEHKTFGGGDWDKYANHLAWDDQATLYMLAAGTTRLIYTVCKKPTIRMRRDETREDFENRCWHWYDPDEGGADKIRVFNVVRVRNELHDAAEQLIELAKTIKRGNFYRNPQACALVSCPFESICLTYRGEIEPVGHAPIGYKRRERRNPELCRF